MAIKSLDQLALKGRRVVLRVDYNVPLNPSLQVADDSRIQASLPTLRYLLQQGCSITLMSHLGRPEGKAVAEFSLAPVAAHLGRLLDRTVPLLADPAQAPGAAPIQMLENLRFFPGETQNDRDFARRLAAFGEVYINDAFGAAHRAHASTAAVAELFREKGAGLLMMKEIHYLREALKTPERPYLAILGGSKVSDKLKLIRNLLNKVDCLMIGGAMSYTFLKARGVEIGKSRVEEDFLHEASALMDLCEQKNIQLLLPLDHLTAAGFDQEARAKITLDQDIDPDHLGLDIGPETIHLYTSTIRAAKTVIWNGPMGVFEWEAYSTGTISVAEAMAESTGLTVIGGGDSVSAANMAGVADQITHISTGGGASLELLGGNELPGLTALESP